RQAGERKRDRPDRAHSSRGDWQRSLAVRQRSPPFGRVRGDHPAGGSGPRSRRAVRHPYRAGCQGEAGARVRVPDPAVPQQPPDHGALPAAPLHSRRRYAGFKHRVATATARLTAVYESLPEKAQLSNAQRWLFDNDYLLWRSLDRIATDMPLRFFARLRLLPGGTPRIEAVMRDYLAGHDRVVVADLQRYLRDQRGETPLDLAELWAVPTF